MPGPIYFAYPGDLETLTGGYHYDRRLIAELRQRNLQIETLSLPHCAPQPDQASLARIAAMLAALPDQSTVIIDGLAFGVLDKIAEAESARLRLLALCHHPLALESGLDESLQAQLLASESRALACARATLVTSEHTRRILVERFALPQEKITVALPGTESVDFAPCTGEPPLLLTLASLTPRKAHDVLLAALAELKDLPWRARFVGDDSLAPDWVARLRQQLESLGLTERIELAGVVNDHLAEYPWSRPGPGRCRMWCRRRRVCWCRRMTAQPWPWHCEISCAIPTCAAACSAARNRPPRICRAGLRRGRSCLTC
jgi:glycosyltransferase involved in cell wall biosynthesis